jgi:hypothetical protein
MKDEERSMNMSEMIETRLAKLERDIAVLKSRTGRDKSNWIAQITGSFKDDPDFDEIVRLGKELRDAEEPEED